MLFDRDELARDELARDELARDILLTGNGPGCVEDARRAYQIADAMIVESEKTNKVFVRFRIGTVEKQPTTLPLAGGHHRPKHQGAPVMAFVLKDDEQVTVTLEFFDKKGKKIASPKLDGAPAWSSSDPAKVSVTPAADGLSAVVVAVGFPDDTATITAEADGDLGEGKKLITTTGDVLVIGGDVATSNMAFGTPAAQP